MEQKINVTITPAANDQWPKVINTMDEFPEGATHFVEQLNGGIIAAYFIVHTDQYNRFMQKEWEETKPGQVICFNDGDALCRWWLNPYPFDSGQEMVKFGDLDLTDTFLYQGTLYHVSTTSFGSENGFAISFESPFGSSFASTDLVTPFKGTITITVE